MSKENRTRKPNPGRPVSGELLRGPILPANRAAKGSCLSLFERTWGQ
jgi:hypothetical protein